MRVVVRIFYRLAGDLGPVRKVVRVAADLVGDKFDVAVAALLVGRLHIEVPDDVLVLADRLYRAPVRRRVDAEIRDYRGAQVVLADGYGDGADGWDDDDDTGMGDYDIPASGTEVPEAVASVPASVSASERSAPVSAAVRASTVPEAGSGGGGFTVGESDVGGSDVGESDVGSDDFPDLPDLEELEDFDGTGAPAPQPDRYDETGGEGGLLAENRELRRLLAIERRRVEILKQALHVCTGDRGR